ncbi:MAG: hypothetical protein PHY87_05930, partial [Sphaerochaeta sp.]|nr:hypothetical protein [Sphaerochaeta sp.]
SLPCPTTSYPVRSIRLIRMYVLSGSDCLISEEHQRTSYRLGVLVVITISSKTNAAGSSCNV